MMIQYAIKNLQNTGHLDKVFDEGLGRLLLEVPEHVALQSLEKFSSCNTKVMRDKTVRLVSS